MNHMAITGLALSFLLLAGCGPVDRPATAVPSPRRIQPVPPPAPPTAAPSVIAPVNWNEAPMTPGTWIYQQDAKTTLALFGEPGRGARVFLRCDLALGRMYLGIAGTAEQVLEGRAHASDGDAPLTFIPAGGTPPYLVAQLQSRDPLLDRIAFSRGRFALSLQGQTPVIAPAWSEIGRVIEDCR